MNRAWIRRTAVLAIAGACALAASGCSSSTSTDAAATATYKDSAGTHTVSVSTKDLLDQVAWLQEKEAVRTSLQSAGYQTNDSGASADASLTAFWLTRMLKQAVYDSVFDHQGLKVSAANTQAAGQTVPTQYPEGVFNAFPKALQKQLIEDQARQAALAESTKFLDPSECKSNRLVSVIATDTEAKAKAAYNELKQGKSFADVARTSSLDSTGQVGGLLGCLNENTLPGELQSAAETVPLNVVTVPIVTNGGAYLVYVQPFDTLKTSPGASSVVALIAGAGMNARFKSMDHVKINPRFGSWGLVQSQQGVQTAVKPPPIPNPANARNTTTTTVPASALAPQGG